MAHGTQDAFACVEATWRCCPCWGKASLLACVALLACKAASACRAAWRACCSCGRTEEEKRRCYHRQHDG